MYKILVAAARDLQVNAVHLHQSVEDPRSTKFLISDQYPPYTPDVESEDIDHEQEMKEKLTDYRPRGHDVIRITNTEFYSRKYSDTNKASCIA